MGSGEWRTAAGCGGEKYRAGQWLVVDSGGQLLAAAAGSGGQLRLREIVVNGWVVSSGG
jgi:hypothetical protein